MYGVYSPVFLSSQIEIINRVKEDLSCGYIYGSGSNGLVFSSKIGYIYYFASGQKIQLAENGYNINIDTYSQTRLNFSNNIYINGVRVATVNDL